MATYNFSNFPKATVAFGTNLTSTESEKLKEHLAVLKKAAHGASQALEFGQKYAPILKISALIAGPLASVITVLVTIVGEVEALYKELKNLEQKIFNTILEGSLRTLNRSLSDLQNTSTSDVQKVAQIVIAISELDKLLPVFSAEDSIFRQRYCQGAPLFIRFCTILKAICLIAEQTPDYNSDLQSLKEDYQKVLDWYKNKCIGRRMASIYVKGMLTIPGTKWTHDWDRHHKTYKKYYEDSTWFPWLNYAENLGGGGWRLWCGWVTYCKLIDTWDIRPYEEVKFEPFEIENTSDEETEREIQYHRDVLAEYRQRVEKVMLEFFHDVSVMT